MSETFVLALRRRETFDPERGSPRAWLYGIASNLLRHHRRAQARHLSAAARLAGQQPAAGPDDHADDRMDAAAAVRRLLPDLLALSDTERDILLLNAWTGLEPTQIAEALGLPAGTVRSKLSRLRRELRAAVGTAESSAKPVVALRAGLTGASDLGSSS